MNAQINQLVKSLLQKESLDQCSVHELQQFADRHPYFGAAQLLLTKKLQIEKPEQYEEQLQKTFLFFHNPLWVEHLLNENGNATIITNEAPVPESISLETDKPLPDSPSPVLITETPVVVVAEETSQEVIQEPVFTKESVEIPVIKTEPEVPPTAELVFEPFHTVDYFASQGIKFREEEKPKDKFGQQLKSFTGWLKSMKRLPIADIVKSVGTSAEQKVEQLAQHSLQEREVLTEAMAEVWEKQGNAEKAIEIYSKLSLLDPPKSRYFAAKIEGLKKIN